ncbi:MAG: hypothetical protein IKL19_03345 [Paludibacteraceae bacterium]|nr:hypothetical protein [Bacteroidales bacterium]MBO5132891.1 hypothetical protein [Paludibacteraceae bacterium]MBQ9100388.1 hypothetical protein [Paludibacteraceae bacterium]MBR6659095.1 hypothetical protein [Paludibacteraceae bacterium]
MKFFKIISFSILALLLIGGGFFYYRYYFVFGEGVKSGVLNYVVYKGYLFKTYEGKMIQSGFKSSQGTGGIQSNEFIFSIENDSLAKKLELLSGHHELDLHYKEYLAPLPWRGNSKYVIDSIVTIRN